MNLITDDAVRANYPDLRVGVVMVRLGEEIRFNDELLAAKNETESSFKRNILNSRVSERIERYNKFYKRFDSRAPMEFQIRSVVNGKPIPTLNPIITCMFISELKNGMLTAGHDGNTLGGDITISLSDGTRSYTRIDGRVKTLKKMDVFAETNGIVINSVLYGPDESTRITEHSRNILFMTYSFGLAGEEIKSHLRDMLSYLKTVSPGLEASGVTLS